MPVLKISAQMAKAIRAAAAAGASHRAIADQVRAEFGVPITHSTIGRYLASSRKAKRRPPATTRTTRSDRATTADDLGETDSEDDGGALDELTILEECARDLRRILRSRGDDAPDHRARPQLNAELRQTLRQIRQQKQAADMVQRTHDDEAARVRQELLTRFAPVDQAGATPSAAEEDDEPDDAGGPELPDVRRASGGG
jgi:hypothetical protein